MFSAQLARRAAEGNPIRVGVIGTGKFGAGLVAQISRMQGMDVAAIADLDGERARNAYIVSGVAVEDIRPVELAGEIDAAIRAGKQAICEDGRLLAEAEQIDVVVEATGVPDVGARLAFHSIEQGKHVVMVNVEADVTIGASLRRLADKAGVVYTLVDGDQPGSTMNIVDWARTLGFEIVAAGRGTILFDDDPRATPESVPERFGFSQETLERRTINLKMFNSFRDGTKAQVEMTALANMTGLVPDIRGMHEPSVNLADIPQRFSLKEEGGLLGQHGVVELANSVAADGQSMLHNPLKMGVFVVIRTDHPFIQEDLATYNVYPSQNGKNFLLYRPYHLVAVAAPMSIAKAVLTGEPTGTPLPQPVAEVITVAKRDLRQGESIDGGGGYTVLGICEKATVARTEGLLPLGLAPGAVLRQDVAAGSAISYAMVDVRRDTFIYKLRQQQDAS